MSPASPAFDLGVRVFTPLVVAAFHWRWVVSFAILLLCGMLVPTFRPVPPHRSYLVLCLGLPLLSLPQVGAGFALDLAAPVGAAAPAVADAGRVFSILILASSAAMGALCWRHRRGRGLTFLVWVGWLVWATELVRTNEEVLRTVRDSGDLPPGYK